MPFIKAQPNEYLVTGQGGKIRNRGLGISAFLWPRTSYVLVSGTQQEANFEMTQESNDGIPLRFKGIVSYRVVRPEETARMFDFYDNSVGHEQIQSLLSHICMGELRAQVAHMSMQECIEQRKTTLKDAISATLDTTVQGADSGWGIEIDIVQVAQVYIVDQELRRQLEAEVRNRILAASELSNLRMKEDLNRASTLAERKRLQESLETERERCQVEQERGQLSLSLEKEKQQAQSQLEQEKLQTVIKLRLQRQQLESDCERQRIEQDAPVQELRIQIEQERAEQELNNARAQLKLTELLLEQEMLQERARQELRKEMLPLEQVPLVAESLAKMFQGANLTFCGEASPLLSVIAPVLDKIRDALEGSAREN